MKLLKLASFVPLLSFAKEKVLLPKSILNTACIHQSDEAIDSKLSKTISRSAYRKESDLANFSLMSDTEKNYSKAFEVSVCADSGTIYGVQLTL